MPNARLSERAPFFAEVDVLATGTPNPRRVWGSDVSETGIFLQTTHPFRVGDRVSLRFDVEDSEVHVRAAEVMWVRPFEPINVDGKLPGVGLKFVAVDPPARAALRRFIQPRVDLLNDAFEGAPLPPLPPPTASLPPITRSIVARAGGSRDGAMGGGTDEMLAVSLPPFSTPPLSITMPPDEPLSIPDDMRVFSSTRAATQPFGTPRPVTMLPEKKASTPPTALAGWTFRRDDDQNVTAPEHPAHDDVEPFDAHAAGLDMRFDDDAPAASLSPTRAEDSDDNPIFDISSSPPEAVTRDARESDDFELGAVPASTSTPPRAAIIDGRDEARERAFEEGSLSMRHLPVGEERRSAPSARTRSRTLPVAVGLLCAGTLVGVGIGMAGKHLKRAPVASTPVVAVSTPAASGAAPARSVADIERDLVKPAAGAVVAVAEAKPVEAKPIDAKPIETKPVETKPVETKPVEAKPVETRPVETKPVEAKPVDAKPVDAPAALTTRAETPKRAAPSGTSFDLDVGDAQIRKVFTLDGPSRVVVDLEGARLPKAAMEPGGRITRVRFGTPAPGTSRVVIELADKIEGDGRAKDVKAEVQGGRLHVTFR